MKKSLPPAALIAIGVVVIGALVLFGVKMLGPSSSIPTKEDTQQMSDFRDHNAAITGGKIDEKSGETVRGGDQPDEARVRGSGN